jgi:phage shock protein A
MKLKRLVASINASFDDFVSRVENHEAVADSVIADVRAAAARLQVQIGRVGVQTQRATERRDALHRDVARWRQRALDLAEADPPRAIECVRRLERTERQLVQSDQQLADLGRLNDQLRANLTDVERRLEDLTLRRASLSSRDARADALRVCTAGQTEDVDRIFDRWEISIASAEYSDNIGPAASDQLDRELSRDEEDEALRQRLATLRRAARDSTESPS